MPGLQEARGAPLTTDADLGARRGRSLRIFVLVAVASLVADQGTKAWALAALRPGEPKDLIGSLIRLNLIRNPGAAFSVGTGRTWVLTIVALVILVVVLSVARRLASVPWAWWLGLLLGGAVGNLVDRFVREPGPGRGHVVDFIDYFGLFIGNVADIAIVVAAVAIAWLSARGIPVDGRGARHVEEATP